MFGNYKENSEVLISIDGVAIEKVSERTAN